MGKYIVTGGGGFIGSHLVSRLLYKGHEVVVVDRNNKPPKGARWIDWDLTMHKFYSCHIEADAVFHLAAQVSADRSFDSPLGDMAINLKTTYKLTEWCKRMGIPRIFFASSMGVYGDGDGPTSYYGANKLASEAYIRCSGLDYTNLRLFTTYGPGQSLKDRMQGLVSIYLSYILANEPIEVKGSLDRLRDLIYVDDVVDFFIMCLDKDIKGTYDVGTGIGTPFFELIQKLLALCDKPKDYPIIPRDGTRGDIFGAVASVDKELGWRHKIYLDTGLWRTVEDYRASLQL